MAKLAVTLLSIFLVTFLIASITAEPSGVGDACESTDECKKVIKGPVSCKDADANRICQCDKDYEPSSDKKECVAKDGAPRSVSIIGPLCVIFMAFVVSKVFNV